MIVKTAFLEANALLAVMEHETEEADRILREFYADELAALAGSAATLASLCREHLDEIVGHAQALAVLRDEIVEATE